LDNFLNTFFENLARINSKCCYNKEQKHSGILAGGPSFSKVHSYRNLQKIKIAKLGKFTKDS
jgi:hypothetical protein